MWLGSPTGDFCGNFFSKKIVSFLKDSSLKAPSPLKLTFAFDHPMLLKFVQSLLKFSEKMYRVIGTSQ